MIHLFQFPVPALQQGIIEAMLTMTVFLEEPDMVEKFMEITKRIFMKY